MSAETSPAGEADSSTDADDNSSSVECPTCGRTDFAKPADMKRHHTAVHGESIAKNETECKECGEDMVVYDCNMDVKSFCSLDCRSAWISENFSGVDHPLSKSEVIECDWCGDEFVEHKHKIESDQNNFCGQKCAGKSLSERYQGEDHPRYTKVGVDCVICGSTFKVAQCLADERKTCSSDCLTELKSKLNSGENHPQYKGGHETWYGESWEGQREKAIERDNHECRACGLSEKTHRERFEQSLHVHHIKPFRTFESHEQANELDNLITLCRPCHFDYEGLPIDTRDNGGK